ncbi:MAG: PilZ domain-containing protein [Thermodesulfobacteriota bacterium]
MSDQGGTPPINRLKYKRGELIAKAGDYGLSIYKVLQGQVESFGDEEGIELILETRRPGDILNAEVFLHRGFEPHPHSIRAVDEAEIEVWHLARLSQEYEKAPPLLKFIGDQMLQRLRRTEKLKTRLQVQPRPETAGTILEISAPPRKTAWSKQSRKFYRKDIEAHCRYRPLNAPDDLSLEGRVKDISQGGLRVEIDEKNLRDFPHEPGGKLNVAMTLPNGRDIKATTQIAHIKRIGAAGDLSMGLAIVHIDLDSQKHLGFFLMP